MRNRIKLSVFAVLFGVIFISFGIVHAGGDKLEIVGETGDLRSHSEFKTRFEFKAGFSDCRQDVISKKKFEVIEGLSSCNTEFKGKVVGEHSFYVENVEQSDLEQMLKLTLTKPSADEEAQVKVMCNMIFDSLETFEDPSHTIITYKILGELEFKNGEVEKARLRGCSLDEALQLAILAEDGDTVTITSLEEGEEDQVEVLAEFVLEAKGLLAP